MKVTTSIATKIVITEADHLDPVTVFIEDYEPGKGKIVIECYGQSWSAYWGGMSGCSVSEFFCSCDEHYLAGCLSPRTSATVFKSEDLRDHAKAEVIRLRRQREVELVEARTLYEDADLYLDEVCGNENLLQKIYGDDWYRFLPESPNPDYAYLCRIINAVKTALRQAEKVAA